MANTTYLPESLYINSDEYKGSIYDGDVLVFRGFPQSEEYTQETFQTTKNVNVENMQIYECMEGTLIRVFFYNDKWYTCTSKKLDAFKSKWASPKTSFGQSFVKALKRLLVDNSPTIDFSLEDSEFLVQFYEKYLSKDKKYMFLLASSEEERIVCDANVYPGVVYLGCETNKYIDMNDEIKLDNVHFPKSKRVYNLKTVTDVCNYVATNTNYRLAQGLVLFHQNPETLAITSIKVMSSEYAVRYALRDNISSIKFRYLELRKTPYDLDLFFEMYPHMVSVSKEIEEKIYQVCKILHALYLRIHVNNEINVECTLKQKLALKAIHRQYVTTRQKTTPSRINDILTCESATIVNGLLRDYYFKSKTDKNEQIEV